MTDGLLLLHAFPLDASMWEPQVSALGGELTVVAPNFPGFGNEPSAGRVMSMDDAAEAAIRAIDRAGLERVVACGLSMGGYVALALWRRHRDRVRGLILANTKAGADDQAGRERRVALAERLDLEGNGFLADAPAPLLSQDATPELWDRVKDIIRNQPAAALAAASLGMGERPDSTGDLAGIDVPTLVLTSTGDQLIPPDVTTPMAGQIPDARLEVVQGAGHLTNLEAPQEFTRLLREHLTASGLG